MRIPLLLTFLLVLFLSTLNGQTAVNAPSESIAGLVAEEELVGITAAYSIDGDIVWSDAAGMADREKGVDMTAGTKMRTASMAKSMTAVAVMQLVEHGKIDLDTPIATYLDDMTFTGQETITCRHLLSHTSGIDGYADTKEIETQIAYPDLTAAFGLFKDRGLLFEPGTQYAYTTYGYVVLGLIIEQLSGQTFEEYMDEHIWSPAGMNSTGVEHKGAEMENTSTLYSRKKQGKLKAAEPNDLSGRIPGGGLYSTATDMVRFGNAVMDGSLIDSTTFDLMRQHHSLEKVNNSYGFGFFLYGAAPDVGTVIGHGGAQTGASAHLFMIPSRGIVVVVMANTSNAGKFVSPAANDLMTMALTEQSKQKQ